MGLVFFCGLGGETKKVKKVLVLLGIFLFFLSGVFGFLMPTKVAAASSDPRLVMNGQEVDPYVPFRISDGRTLMPVIQLQRSMGMIIEWDGAKSQVTIKDRGRVVVMTINSKIVYIDGIQKSLDIPPVIIQSRTYLPLRSLGNLIQQVVAWEDTTRTVVVNRNLGLTVNGKAIPVTMNQLPQGTFADLFSVAKGLGISYSVNGTQLILTKGNLKQTLPLLTGESGSGGYRRIDGHTVIPLSSIQYLVNGKGQWQGERFIISSSQPVSQPVVQPSSHPFTIMIDPGHGSQDSGCIGADGQTYEKNFNLSVGQKLVKRLQGNGNFKVLTTRQGDTYPTLDQRVDEANQAGADVFISIHANAADSSASGTESYYYNSYSQPFAQIRAKAFSDSHWIQRPRGKSRRFSRDSWHENACSINRSRLSN